MQNDTTTTVHVALDVHKDLIAAAYSVGLGEVQNLGNVGVLERDITKLCTRMQSKGRVFRSSTRPGPPATGCTGCSPRRVSHAWCAHPR